MRALKRLIIKGLSPALFQREGERSRKEVTNRNTW
jgi:hypothetical protein